jgi:hypothetical protein
MFSAIPSSPAARHAICLIKLPTTPNRAEVGTAEAMEERADDAELAAELALEGTAEVASEVALLTTRVTFWRKVYGVGTLTV